MQALLYGMPYTALFEGADLRARMFAQLVAVIEMAGLLGTRNLVFGSPKHRIKGVMTMPEAIEDAAPFFRRLGEVASDNDVCLCIEPNPEHYGCDFVTDSTEGIALVDAVNHPGFGLHLDAAGMTLAGENVESAISAAGPRLRHFHISEKDLAPIGSGSVDHAAVAAALADSDYPGWLSIEMRPVESNGIAVIESALEAVSAAYGNLTR